MDFSEKIEIIRKELGLNQKEYANVNRRWK